MDKIEKAVEKFQKKFSSISVIKNDISGNMYESISDWLRQALLTAHEQGKKDRDEETVKELDEILCNYSEDRPIPPSIIRAFQDTFTKQ